VAHLTYELVAESEVAFQLFEDTTTTSDGTSLSSFNRDRNSTEVATAIAYHTPTVATTGTEIRGRFTGNMIPAGQNDREILLKKNTKYLFRVTNAVLATNRVTLKLDWYELANA
jgi:hypothetical protein